MERGGAAATASAAGAKVFGGSRLKTLWNFKRGGAPPAPPPPESASDRGPNPESSTGGGYACVCLYVSMHACI